MVKHDTRQNTLGYKWVANNRSYISNKTTGSGETFSKQTCSTSGHVKISSNDDSQSINGKHNHVLLVSHRLYEGKYQPVSSSKTKEGNVYIKGVKTI